MKLGIILSLVLSLFLVGGAVWLKLTNNKISPGLIAQKSANNIGQEGIFLNLVQSDNPEPATENPITSTDMVSEQFLSDYLNLAMSGEATQENLSALAEQYANSISSLAEASKIDFLDINIVEDSQSSLANYSRGLDAVYTKHAASVSAANSDSAAINGETLNFSILLNLSTVYKATSEELRELAVPKSVAEAHLELVNQYISSSIAIRSAAETARDPMKGMAGLIIMNENLSEEEIILSKIKRILISKGGR